MKNDRGGGEERVWRRVCVWGQGVVDAIKGGEGRFVRGGGRRRSRSRRKEV